MERSYKYKMGPGRIVFLVFAVILLILIAVACLLPLWHVIMASISNPTDLNVAKGLILKPLRNVDTTAYKLILQYQKLWRGYRNTIMYCALSCVFTGIMTVIAGYVFSRNRFFYRNAFMLFISFTMLFNGGMIPTYMVIRKLGMIDTVWALTVPGCLSVFNIILMRTSMQGISDALEEAARLDGANDFVIMFKIILPLCKATFAVVTTVAEGFTVAKLAVSTVAPAIVERTAFAATAFFTVIVTARTTFRLFAHSELTVQSHFYGAVFIFFAHTFSMICLATDSPSIFKSLNKAGISPCSTK